MVGDPSGLPYCIYWRTKELTSFRQAQPEEFENTTITYHFGSECLRKPRSERHAVVFEKRRFQNIFRARKNGNLFSGLKRVFAGKAPFFVTD